MLKFAIEYCPTIDTMTATQDFDLCKYELLPAEWKIAQELHDVLQIFKDATLFFSQGTPSLATVIPTMDHINKVLATSSDNPHQFTVTIHAALAIGKRAMNRYYNKTDHSNVYWIVMVLHPRHKLEYFKRQRWEIPWVQDTHNIVCRTFDRSY
ncbi:hypothetical protein EI94DRAFT_1503973, partial [Lactarius quietus]